MKKPVCHKSLVPHVYLINIGVEGQLHEGSIASYSGQSVAEASHLGALGDVLRLVEAKADINSKDDYGYTALHHMAGVPGLAGVEVSCFAACI